MALQHPCPTARVSQKWGIPLAGTASLEPPGYAMLQRFWWSKPPLPGTWLYYRHYHPGIDLAAALGTPIVASERGLVQAVGLNPTSPISGIRMVVQIRPGAYLGTIYGHGHLSRIAINPRTKAAFKVGDKILRGEVMAYMGQTGGATGPNTHFFVQSVVPGTRQSIIYDPTLFLPGGANQNDPRILPYY